MQYGSQMNPPNRFQSIQVVEDNDHLEWDVEYLKDKNNPRIEYLEDHSKTIVTENDSPDISFRYSVNPYRGCVHGCSYCYARPYHEFLGLNAGLDFETKIFVKPNSGNLLRTFLSRSSWEAELIAFSGVTDCYQPIERKLRITRDCLEVCAEANQPISIVTKNALVARDIDLLKSMSEKSLVQVSISLTTLKEELARRMEPRTSRPAARLRAISELSDAGIPVRVMISPIIPGLNEDEIPVLLKAAHEAGAISAGSVLLRLPLTVESVFQEWIGRELPDQQSKVLNRIRQCRDGNLNDSRFGSRMKGTGPIAKQIEEIFRLFCQRYSLDKPLPPVNSELFTPPKPTTGQLHLF